MIDRTTVWTPRVTVASILEREGRFLLVEESVGGRLVLNQPAGHLEDDESLLAAVVRETREETAWAFIPEALVGVYRWRTPDKTFLRFVFCGRADGHDPHQALDPDINRAVWLSWEELRAGHFEMRSPLVLRCLEDYRDGQRFPLELMQDVPGTAG
ncbi:MAG: NUDIX hydrolase [Xanthomonadaceae bacterium]|nr:NUDIX hydrolase [Xanthomonadaceae bacterium]